MTQTFPPWHRLLHILWTKAVGQPDYDKATWLELEAECAKLQRAAEGRS